MKSIKRIILGILSLFLLSFTACSKTIPFTSIAPKDALSLINGNSGVILIDVRTPEEFRTIRIPGSILLPDYDIKEKIGEVVPDKNTSLIVYCRSGSRSSKAAKTLTGMGYTKVFDLGGIINWPYDTEAD